MAIDLTKKPEGATHINPHNGLWIKYLGGGGGHYQFFKTGQWEMGFGCMSNSYLEIAQPEPWKGEGLPPVGTVCEFVGLDNSDWHRELRNGAEVRVIAHFEGPNQRLAAFTFECTGGLQVEQGTEICFAPIRTAEQKAAEEREKGIEQMVQDLTDTDEDGFEHIRCGVLWDAGYRKAQP